MLVSVFYNAPQMMKSAPFEGWRFYNGKTPLFQIPPFISTVRKFAKIGVRYITGQSLKLIQRKPFERPKEFQQSKLQIWHFFLHRYRLPSPPFPFFCDGSVSQSLPSKFANSVAFISPFNNRFANWNFSILCLSLKAANNERNRKSNFSLRKDFHFDLNR
jgi:hypothetical protein